MDGKRSQALFHISAESLGKRWQEVTGINQYQWKFSAENTSPGVLSSQKSTCTCMHLLSCPHHAMQKVYRLIQLDARPESVLTSRRCAETKMARAAHKHAGGCKHDVLVLPIWPDTCAPRHGSGGSVLWQTHHGTGFRCDLEIGQGDGLGVMSLAVEAWMSRASSQGFADQTCGGGTEVTLVADLFVHRHVGSEDAMVL